MHLEAELDTFFSDYTCGAAQDLLAGAGNLDRRGTRETADVAVEGAIEEVGYGDALVCCCDEFDGKSDLLWLGSCSQ